MKVSEKKEFVGEFYLPQDPRYKIPGVLKIGLNGEVCLEICGNFEPFPYDEIQQCHPMINGDVTSVGRVALVDCFYRKFSSPLGGPQQKNMINARFALCNLNTDYENADEIKFNKLHFSVEHLNEWLGFVGGNLIFNDRKEATIKYTHPEDITVELDDGIQMQFAFNSKYSMRVFDGDKVIQSAYIGIESKQSLSLSDFTDLVGKINVFLCLALNDIVCIKDVAVPKDGHQSAIQIYYQSFVRAEKSRKRHFSGALCQFHDIEDNLAAILNGWLKKYEFTRPTYSLYLSCKMGGVRYTQNMFLSLVQALENLSEAGCDIYDDWPEPERNEKLKSKLNKLICTFKEDLIPRDQYAMWDEIIEDVRGVRNYLPTTAKPRLNLRKNQKI